MKKKILSMLLATLMIMSSMAIMPISANAVENADLVISNADDLVAFDAAVDGGNDYAGKTIVLGGDIDLSGVAWTAIGTKDAAFCGTFDGQGYTISGLTCNPGNYDRHGALFAMLGTNAVVKNFKLEGTITIARTVNGNSGRWGTIAGQVIGTNVLIQNVHSSVNIDGSKYENINPTNCGLFYVGGIVGEMLNSSLVGLTIDGCVYDGAIISNATASSNNRPAYFGGFVGNAGQSSSSGQRTLTIRNSAFAGSISIGSGNHVAALVGGIFDDNSTYGTSVTIENVISIGSVSISQSSKTTGNGKLVGAFGINVASGINSSGYTPDVSSAKGKSTLTMTNVYYTDVAISDNVVGTNSDSNKITATNVVCKTLDGMAALTADAFSSDTMSVKENSGETKYYPCPSYFTADGAWVSSLMTGPALPDLVISDAAGLVAFAAAVEGGNNYKGKVVVLTADVDLSDVEWNSIGNSDTNYLETKQFKGTFDGKGHTVTLATTASGTTGNEGGLFSALADGAVVKNLKLNGDITCSGNVNFLGALVARVCGNVTISGVHSSVNILQPNGSLSYSGGLVGFIQNNQSTTLTIDGCIYDGRIWTQNAANSIGGLLGYTGNSGANRKVIIKNSVFAGTFDIDDYKDSGKVGGFIGYVRAFGNGSVLLELTNLISVGTFDFVKTNADWDSHSANFGTLAGAFGAEYHDDGTLSKDSDGGRITVNPISNFYYIPVESPKSNVEYIGVYGAFTTDGTTSNGRVDNNSYAIDGELTLDMLNGGEFVVKESDELTTYYPCPTALAPTDGSWLPSLTVAENAKVLGAAIRCTDAADAYSGLRFVSMFRNTSGIEHGGAADANFGIILISKAKYDVATDNASVAGLVAAGGVQVKATKVDTSVDGYTKVSAVIYNIQSANYEDEVVAVSYVNDTLVGASDCESIYTVAVKCVEQNDDTPAALAFAQQIKNAVESN